MKRFFYGLPSLVLLLAVVSASAQSRFGLSITGGPIIGQFNVRLNYLLPDANGQPIPAILVTDVTTNGYAAGIMGHYKFTPNWSISSGLWYSDLSRADPYKTLGLPARVISQDWQVPLLINYRLTHRRLSPYFSVGSLATFHKSTIYRLEGSLGSSDLHFPSSSKVNFQAMAGVGISYNLTRHWSLIAQPLLIWHFKPQGDYEHYVVYQVNGQVQLMYSF